MPGSKKEPMDGVLQGRDHRTVAWESKQGPGSKGSQIPENSQVPLVFLIVQWALLSGSPFLVPALNTLHCAIGHRKIGEEYCKPEPNEKKNLREVEI